MGRAGPARRRGCAHRSLGEGEWTDPALPLPLLPDPLTRLAGSVSVCWPGPLHDVSRCSVSDGELVVFWDSPVTDSEMLLVDRSKVQRVGHD